MSYDMNKALQLGSSCEDRQPKGSSFDRQQLVSSSEHYQDSQINLKRLHLASDSELEDYKGSQEQAFLYMPRQIHSERESNHQSKSNTIE